MRKLSLLVSTITLFVIGCSSDDKNSNGQISPSNPNVLSEVLVIPNSTVVDSPDLPDSSGTASAPAVTNMDTNISYSSGSQIILPMDVVSPMGGNIKGVYIQVEGASTYFDVAINSSTSNGTFSIPINLPDIVGAGDFVLILKFYDYDGNISLEVRININVTRPSICNTTKASGGQGLTSIIFELADEPGIIKVEYDTYFVKDKIDVFQNGVWLGGTGPQTDRSTLRRALNCNVATKELGYVGEEGEFIFTYNPEFGNEIEVVVSGCENGGTAWKYTFSCPYEGGNTGNGTGQFIFDGVTYNGQSYVQGDYFGCGGGVTGVSVFTGTGNSAAEGITFYNIPQASSGTYQIYDFDDPNLTGCELSGSCYTDKNHFTQSGTLTKTGAKSFTFSCVVYYVHNHSETYTVTGTVSY